MTSRNKSVEDIIIAIRSEGMGYALQHYMGPNINCPEDEKLEWLWKKAALSIAELQKHIETNHLQVWEENEM